MRSGRSMAFTLIELLVTVAIIAILAAIAVPNLLEAQTRSKAARVKSDLRTVATAIEAYAVENLEYPPNDGFYNALPRQITTPVAYLTRADLVDPFTAKEWSSVYGVSIRHYRYYRIVSQKDFFSGRVKPAPPIQAIDGPLFNAGAMKKYGQWRLLSFGPDRKLEVPGAPHPILRGADIPYESTNGSISWGNILRTQRSPEGRMEVYE